MGMLARAGVEVPDGATIWGPGEGRAWRLVGKDGRSLKVGSRVTLRALAAAGEVELETTGDGWQHLRPVGQSAAS